MKKVTHIIVGLGKGGAETMLYQVLKYRQSNFKYEVISLGQGNYFREPIEKLGITVREVNIKKSPITGFIKIVRMVKNTDVLCCWMYHANLIGFFASLISGKRKIIWCIRHSSLNPLYEKKSTLFVNSICARLSKHVSAILYNGERARKVHEEAGYCSDHGFVTDNGCDMEIFKHIEGAKESVREELGVESDKKILLSVTRNAPIKDIPNFVQAFADYHGKDENSVAVLCGNGITNDNQGLVSLCSSCGLTVGSNIFLLGLREDIPRIMSACDLFVLHSAGEAFPNTLIQAMACETMCVTTDVGDAGKIIRNDSFVAIPKDEAELCKTMLYALSLDEKEKEVIKKENRNIVNENYDIRKVVQQYEEAFESC